MGPIDGIFIARPTDGSSQIGLVVNFKHFAFRFLRLKFYGSGHSKCY